MSWDQRIFRSVAPSAPLSAQIDELLLAQRRDWREYDQAVAALDDMICREYHTEDGPVMAKVNPRRGGSIYAKTDAVSVAKRPCFLCEKNLPPLEQGLAQGDLVVFPNPFPIHRRHLTIPLREHEPQAIVERLGAMVALADACGPEMIVFYNGPRCGASAPDHLHFQACERQGVPLISQIETLVGEGEGMKPLRLSGRRIIAFRQSSAQPLVEQLKRSLAAMNKPHDDTEPMVNLIVWRAKEGLLAVLMPRASHRPSCFYAEGEARIAISPAALELAGLLVVSDEIYLDRLTPEVIRSIYDEVCYNEADFTRLVEDMA